VTGITNSKSCCYAISANMQVVTKIVFVEKLWFLSQRILFILKHTGDPAVRELERSMAGVLCVPVGR